MEIKHPPKNGVLPIPLEFQSFDPEWIWVYGDSVLICAGAHDLVILLRLVRWGEMPPMWIHRLIQHALKECRERGYKRFMTWLAKDVYAEQQLLKIAAKYGAQFEPFNGDLAAGMI